MELLCFLLYPGKHKSLTVFRSRFPRPDAESVPAVAPLHRDTSNYCAGSHRHSILSHKNYAWAFRWIRSSSHNIPNYKRVLNLGTWGQKGSMRSKALEHSCFQLSKIEFVTYTHSSTSHLRGLFFPYWPYIVQFSEEKRMMGKNTEKYFRIFGMIIF